MQKCNLLIVLITFLVLSLPIHAEVVFDGTLGHSGALPGPNFDIQPKYGQQQGGNLFHSFSQFNIYQGESATFSGPNSIENIISRVTGGNPSQIDGLFRSTIPNADVYFLNPYGIMFGEGAKLDVQGSFHASTADYLRLSDGGEFNARYPNNSLLTVAPIESFGFLTNSPSSISLQDSKLSVPEGETLSLIGGNINMESEQELITSDGPVNNALISANSGRINLASVASKGEVIPTNSNLILSENTLGGQLTINNSFVITSGNGGGDIFIRGGDFEINKSYIDNSTFGWKDSELLDIQVNNLTMANGAQIYSHTRDSGNAGKIIIKAINQLTMKQQSMIFSVLNDEELLDAGNAGDIYIETEKIILIDEARIGNGTNGYGNGGKIVIKANDTLKATGEGSGVFAFSMSEKLFDAGNAGNIDIEAGKIILTDKAQISNVAIASGNAGDIEIKAGKITLIDGAQIGGGTISSGNTGKIVIKVDDTLTAIGTSTDKKYRSGIFATSNESFNAGNAGNIEIEADKIILNSGVISSATKGFGNAGNIEVKANKITLVDGGIINSSTFGSGNAGNIEIKANKINLTDGLGIASATLGTGNGGKIIIKVNDTLTVANSGISSGSYNDELSNAGDAGNIDIEAGKMTLTNGGVATVTLSSGNAGNIKIKANRIALVDGGVINSSTLGSGNAGKIIIKVDDTLKIIGKIIKDNRIYRSGIFAVSGNDDLPMTRDVRDITFTGDVGNIDIEADKIILADDGVIAASSDSVFFFGNPGNINIKTTEIILTDGGTISIFKVVSGLGSGDIEIEASKIILTGDSSITANTIIANAGNITLKIHDLLYLLDSSILTDVTLELDLDFDFGVNGGNITIHKPVFVVLDGAKIITKARRGFGGDIKIDSQQFLSSADKNNVLDASSDVLERSGNILITAPEEDISGSLLILPATLFNVPDLKNQCAGKTRSTLNKLIVIDRNVPPTTPDDLKTHYIRRLDAPKPMKSSGRSSVIPEQIF